MSHAGRQGDTGVGTGTAQLVPAVRKSWGKKGRERRPWGCLSQGPGWTERYQGWGCPAITQSHSSSLLQEWGGWQSRDGAAWLQAGWAVLPVGLWVVAKPQRCPLALCPELFRQQCCPGWSLPWPVSGLVVGCCWFQLAAGVGDTGITGLSSSANTHGVCGGCQDGRTPLLCLLPSSNLTAQAHGLATKAA